MEKFVLSFIRNEYIVEQFFFCSSFLNTLLTLLLIAYEYKTLILTVFIGLKNYIIPCERNTSFDITGVNKELTKISEIR